VDFIQYNSRQQSREWWEQMVTVTKSGPGELFAFAAEVSAAGYRITKPTLAVVPKRPPQSSSEFLNAGGGLGGYIESVGEAITRRYPLDESDNIAREFAAVGATDHDILEFTNRYGVLRDLPKSNTREGFRNYQKFVATVLQRLDALPGRWETKTAAAKQRAGRLEMARWFNSEFQGLFDFRLHLPDAPGATGGLRVTPASLLSAIGLLLAYEITGSIEWKTCMQCGKSFPTGSPSNRVRRSDAKTCSDACTRLQMDQRKADKRAKAAKAVAIKVKPRKCPHCGDSFTPKARANATTEHCGKSKCKTAASRARASGGAK
jgi:hypothetical protein